MLRRMELPAEDSEHVHAGERFSLQEDSDVVAVDFEANGFLDGGGGGLMGSLLEHGGEAEEFAMSGLVDDDFLVILVDGGDAHLAGNHHVGLASGVSYFVDALAGREVSQLDLSGQDSSFILVEQREERDVFEHFRIAGHE